MKSLWLFFLLFTLIVLHSTAYAASFDCNRASTQIERTICADPDLNRADELLGYTYKRAKAHCKDENLQPFFCPTTIAGLNRSHKTWLKFRLQKCSANNAECLLPLYVKYTDDLRKQLSRKALIDSSWKVFYDGGIGPLGESRDFGRCDYRPLYCVFRKSFHFSRLQQISGLNLYLPGGPHGQELNVGDETRFGYYNPDFLSWFEGYMIPADRQDLRYNRFTQAIYDRPKIKAQARLLYLSHQILFAQGEMRERFLIHYQMIAEEYREKTARGEVKGYYFENSSDNSTQLIKDTELIKERYLSRVEEAMPNHINYSGGFLMDELVWLGDYLATVEEKLWDEKSSPWYFAFHIRMIGGYWIRRSIDGTEDQLFRMLSKVLEVYDPDFLLTPPYYYKMALDK